MNYGILRVVEDISVLIISEMPQRTQVSNKFLFKAGVTLDVAENSQDFATLTGYFQLYACYFSLRSSQTFVCNSIASRT